MNAQTNIQKNNKSLINFFKECIMSRKITKFDILIALISLCSIILCGCGTIPVVSGVLPISQPEIDTEPVLPPVFGPEAAREAALHFVRVSFGSSIIGSDLIWVDSETPSEEIVGSSTFQYISDDWTSRVSFSVVAPDAMIYTVKIQRESTGFIWEGLVDANGKVATILVNFDNPSPTPEVIEPEPTLVPEPTPTLIPEPTPTLEPTSIPEQKPCNVIKFIADITILDGSIFLPNMNFTKVWRLKNVGSCTWNRYYELIFIDGSKMGAAKTVALPTNVRPGEVVDVSVAMISPSWEGKHIGFWMLRSVDGEIFGLGDTANKAFWVSIRVDDPGSSAPSPEEISAWEGYIWSTEFGAQYDDYFERTDLSQSLLFGIESRGIELQEMIESLRDTGIKVRLAGTLYSNVIDYNSSQILVTKIYILE